MTDTETETIDKRRLPVACRAVSPDNVPCRWRAVMAWHSIPFCTLHAPVRRPGIGGWVRL